MSKKYWRIGLAVLLVALLAFGMSVTAFGALVTPTSTGNDPVISIWISSGCTLTPGYWKAHSTYGPAPYNETWVLIGESTTFFYSGKTYYEVLWTPPAGGNAYYILTHAYIAAELNE